MSFLGLGAVAGGGLTTVTTIATAAVGGAVVAGVFAVGATQIAANITQPSASQENIDNVNAPAYDK